MSNSIAPGSSADVNVKVTALTTNSNVPAQYKTIILKKNLVNGVNTLTQAMMNKANTKYVIKYDYTLGDDITVPANCVLEFDGGSISGTQTIIGNNTGIEAGLVKIFNTDVTLNGTWNVKRWNICWFGCIGNGIYDNAIYIAFAMQQIENIAESVEIYGYGFPYSGLFVPNGKFLINSKVSCTKRLNLYGTGTGSIIICNFGGTLFELPIGTSTIDIQNIAFRGTNPFTPGSSAIAKEGGHIAIGNISNCIFSSFDTAIIAETFYWTRITNCFFSYNKCNIKAKNCNDFSITNCNFRADNYTKNQLVFHGGMSGVNICGCDFSGGYGSSILIERTETIDTTGCGVSIQGNYFEPGINYVDHGEIIAGPVLSLHNVTMTDLIFQGNSVWEDGLTDSTAPRIPRYWIEIYDSYINMCHIVGHLVFKDSIKGKSNTACATINVYNDFTVDEVNLIDKYENSLDELVKMNPGTPEYNSLFADITITKNSICSILGNTQKTIDNLRNNVLKIWNNFSQINLMYENIIYTPSINKSGSDSYPNNTQTGDTYYNTTRNVLAVRKIDGTYKDVYNYTPAARKGSTNQRNVYIEGQNSLLSSTDTGFTFFDNNINKEIILVKVNSVLKWVEFDGATAGVKRNGNSTTRPSGTDIYVGFMYMDTTLGKPIYASVINGDTVTWVDATGTQV